MPPMAHTPLPSEAMAPWSRRGTSGDSTGCCSARAACVEAAEQTGPGCPAAGPPPLPERSRQQAFADCRTPNSSLRTLHRSAASHSQAPRKTSSTGNMARPRRSLVRLITEATYTLPLGQHSNAHISSAQRPAPYHCPIGAPDMSRGPGHASCSLIDPVGGLVIRPAPPDISRGVSGSKCCACSPFHRLS